MIKLKKIKLPYLIIGIMIIAIFSTAFISIWGSYRSFNNFLIQDKRNTHEEYTTELVTRINNYLHNTIQGLNDSTASIVENMLDNDFLIQEVERLVMQNHLFDSAIIVNKEGSVLASTLSKVEFHDEWRSLEGVVQTTRGPIISEPFQASGDKSVILMANPIFSKNNEYVGFIGGTFDVTENIILPMILDNDFDDDVSILIVDSKGKIIIGEGNHKRLQQVVSGSGVLEKDEKMSLVGHSVVPLTGWGIFVQRQLDKEDVPKDIFIKNLIFPLLPFLLVVLAVITWFAVKMAKPIHQIALLIEEGVEKESKQPFEKVEAWYFETQFLKNVLLSREAFIRNRMMALTDQLVLDPLTGIINRRGIDEVLDEWVINDVPHAIIMLDLDYFKSVNDTYGHTVGDEVLKDVAKNMLEEVSEKDICCRYGGEEFLILLPYSTIDNALAVAERLRVKQAFSENLCGRPVTLSAGIATYPTMAKTPNQLIEIADKALYKAKKTGRNCIQVAGDFSGNVK